MRGFLNSMQMDYLSSIVSSGGDTMKAKRKAYAIY